MTAAEIRSDVQSFLAMNPPPPLGDAAIVRLRGLLGRPEQRRAA